MVPTATVSRNILHSINRIIYRAILINGVISSMEYPACCAARQWDDCAGGRHRHSARQLNLGHGIQGAAADPLHQRARAPALLALHRLEEFTILLRILHLVEQELDRSELVHGVQELAQDPHLRELSLIGDELFLA